MILHYQKRIGEAAACDINGCGDKRHGRGSNPRSSVYETDALPLGHRACAAPSVSITERKVWHNSNATKR
ncbi:hypothetical protein AMECASPLE_024232 [Ameca splendens]|uniref:Uncharacterized protein n=1 Tax=Ameca splendens TaxID=208324 RepID=A0ABV0YS02_9TELE